MSNSSIADAGSSSRRVAFAWPFDSASSSDSCVERIACEPYSSFAPIGSVVGVLVHPRKRPRRLSVPVTSSDYLGREVFPPGQD